MGIDISNEKSNYVAQGIQHKYSPTLVVIVSDTCKKICDWCFRGRIFIDKKLENDVIANPDTAIEYAKKHTEIKSILLTGGDAFLADKNYLKNLLIEYVCD